MDVGITLARARAIRLRALSVYAPPLHHLNGRHVDIDILSIVSDDNQRFCGVTLSS